jgi:predicted double-glycine peptidase
MSFVKSFKSFQNAEEKASQEVEAGANPQMVKEEDVTLTDPTLKDLSAKILQYKTQINLWEKAIEERKKVLGDTLAKNATAAQNAAANQPQAPTPTPTA